MVVVVVVPTLWWWVVAPLLHYPCPCLSVACVWGVLDSVGGDILLRGPGSGIAAQYLPSPSVDSVLRQPGCLLHNNPRTVTSVPVTVTSINIFIHNSFTHIKI